MAKRAKARAVKTKSARAIDENSFGQMVESTALWAFIISAVITFFVMFGVNAGRTVVPIVPDRGSLGFQALMASALVSLILTPLAYNRSRTHREAALPAEIRGRYRWSIIPITIANILLVTLITAFAFEVITRSFLGLELSRLSASLRLGTFVGVLAYGIVAQIMRMRISSLIYVGIFYLFATLLIAGATNANPTWYENSFSYLGMTESSSKMIFNLGLPFTGLLIIIWSFYFAEHLRILLQANLITERTFSTVRWALILTGILLSLVGIVRFGISPFFNVVHQVSATGMGVVLGLLMLFMPKLIPQFRRVFYIYSYLTVVGLVLAVVLMVVGVYSLTGLEVSAFVAAGFWLLVFYRNVDDLVTQLRPDVRI